MIFKGLYVSSLDGNVIYALTIHRSLFTGIAKNFSGMSIPFLEMSVFTSRYVVEIFAIRWFLGMFESAMYVCSAPGFVGCPDHDE